jgi:hypothetical protein
MLREDTTYCADTAMTSSEYEEFSRQRFLSWGLVNLNLLFLSFVNEKMLLVC